jgi:hypothetical protein
MAQILNEIIIGQVEKYNGMTMCRKVSLTNAFKGEYYINDAETELLPHSRIVVFYNEYFKNSEGQIVNELTVKNKNYVLFDEQFETEGREKWLPVSVWFNGIARTPVTLANGVLDSIELTLSKLPINVTTDYIVKYEDFL